MQRALWVLVLVGCWSGRTTPAPGPDEPREAEADKTKQRDAWDRDQTEAEKKTKQRDADRAQFLKDSEPTELAQPPGTFVVAGCNTGCKHCAIGGKTNVHGIDVKTGTELFPAPNGGAGGGFSCSAALPLHTHVRLVAKSGEGLVLESWRPFNSDDYCPCAGTAQAVCDVVVTEQIAAKYKRVYCGADWKQQAPAQIGH